VERERKKYIVRERERERERERARGESWGEKGRAIQWDIEGGLYVRGKDRRGVDKKRGQA
jgi:hypothetical protein